MAKAKGVLPTIVLPPVPGPTPSGFYGTRADSVEPKSVKWIWKQVIPEGKIITIDGDPEAKKTFACLDIAARITTGDTMPDGTRGVKGGVIILSGEDDPEDTLVPRLIAAGADLEKICFLKTYKDPATGEERIFTFPDSFPVLEAVIKDMDVRFIIVDPLEAFVTSNVNKNQEVRHGVLNHLATLMADNRCTTAFIRHLNKNSDEANPLLRGQGSMAIIGAARAALMAIIDDEEPTISYFCRYKCNVAREPRNFAYMIEDVPAAQVYGKKRALVTRAEPVGRVRWLGKIQQTAKELMHQQGRNLSDDQKHVLQYLAEHGPTHYSTLAEEVDCAPGAMKSKINRLKERGLVVSSKQGAGMWDRVKKSRVRIRPFDTKGSKKEVKEGGDYVTTKLRDLSESHVVTGSPGYKEPETEYSWVYSEPNSNLTPFGDQVPDDEPTHDGIMGMVDFGRVLDDEESN